MAEYVWVILACVVCLIFAFVFLLVNRVISSSGGTLSSRGKSVFISGCDTGIGHRLALYCHDNLGLTVFAGCLNPEGQGAERLRSKGSQRLHVVSLDVTSQESVQRAVEFVQEHLPPEEKGLWALINNAGVCVFGEFEWQTWRQCQFQVDVNLLGTVRLTKAFLRSIRNGRGRIITITSVNGQCAYPGTSIYSATKFALEGFNDALRREMSKFGVRVIVVQPGDLARLTNIMKSHETHAKDMWNEMADKEKNVYGDYFHTYHRQVALNQGITSPPDFETSPLLNHIRHSLLCHAPRERYQSFPLAMKIALLLFKLTPTSWGDAVIGWIFKRVFKAELPPLE